MVTKQAVLEYLEELERLGGSLKASGLATRFRCSLKASSWHLNALWREQLIEVNRARLRGWRFRLRPGERIDQLAFRLAERGRQRLVWYRDGPARDEPLILV